MEKSINKVVQEFKDNIAQAINTSGLPAVVIELLLKDVYNEVHSIYLNELVQEEHKEGEE